MKEVSEGTPKSALETVPIGRLLPRFAVPCVLSMLVSALYNIVDQVFIGQSVGYLGNAATNVVYPYTVIALALALLPGDGGAALLSLSRGRGQEETARRCVGGGMVLILLLSVPLVALGLLAPDAVLGLFGVTPACAPYARDYFGIIVYGVPFYMFSSGMNAAIRADGSPAYAMAATTLGAVLNLILDPVAIFVLGWGVQGAALATVIGQMASCAVTVAYFLKPRALKLDRNSFRLDGAIVGRIFRLGAPSLVIQWAIVIIMSVANRLIGIFGPQSVYGADIPLSVVGIVMKVFGIVIAISVGISLGGQPIAGYHYGAGNYRRVFQVYRYVLAANLVLGALSVLLFEICPQGIIDLFGQESALYREYAVLCFRVFLSGIMLTCLQKASSIFLQSIGKSGKATLLSISRDVLFFVPAIVLLARQGGVTGMLWAAPIADVLSALLAVFLVAMEYRAVKRKEQVLCASQA